MPTNIFQDPSKTIPKSDSQIVRVPLDTMDIGGRKEHLPASSKNDMSISHVPNQGSKG